MLCNACALHVAWLPSLAICRAMSCHPMLLPSHAHAHACPMPEKQLPPPPQIAITATGLIWSRFSTQIVPVGAALRHGRALALRLGAICPFTSPP